MKKELIQLTFIACFAAACIAACSSPAEQKEEKVQEAKDKVVEAKQELQQAMVDSSNEYMQYKEASEKRLRANDKIIADLKSSIKTEKTELRAKYQKQLDEIEKKNEKLKTKIEESKEDAKEKWVVFKENFNREMDTLGMSISSMAEKKLPKK